MPYRRLPNTDAARLRALKTLLDNSDIYTARNRFIDWKSINKARRAYDRLLTAAEQYRMCYQAQRRNAGKGDKLQRNATIYVSHFVQVLLMAVERGEIKRATLSLYGLGENAKAIPQMKSVDSLISSGLAIIEGERQRIKGGGRPIFNPTIGMVSTHLDIFRQSNEQQKTLQRRTAESLEPLRQLRPEADAVLLELWNQIETYYRNLPKEERIEACRRLGVIYYDRRKEREKPNVKDKSIL